MAPPALLAIWLGGPYFAVLIAVAAAVMAWEWHRMVTKSFGPVAQMGAAGCLLAVLLALWQPVPALGLVAAVAAASAVLTKGPRLWAGLGMAYVGVPAVVLVLLRGDGEAGLHTMFWLMLLVWATDIGAYIFGRTIGGPLLLPVVSPKKTWAGLIGGMISAGLVGLGTAYFLGLAHPAALTAGSALLAVVAQAGDLLESWVKRYWGVKDSSNIIPGHGGVLDRVDGLLAAALAVALMSWISGIPVLQW